MNKFIPMFLSVALLGGSVAMAAPGNVSKTHRTGIIRKLFKHHSTKKAPKAAVSK